MSGAKVTYKVPFARERNPQKTIPAPPSRTARMLALAHRIDQLVESGEVGSYGEAARRLGITSARITQIMDLTLLAPSIQQGILEGNCKIDGKRVQHLSRKLSWAEQEEALEMLPS